MQVLRANTKHLPSSEHELAQELLRREQEILEIFRSVLQARIGALRTRIHGDYHLGQVLYTGKDFVIIDFEGEPLRSIYQRRIKRSPLRDVAGMLRSFEYASFTALFGREAVTAGEDAARLIDFARDWTVWVSAAFLKAYLSRCAGAAFIPRDQRALEMMLTAFQLDKAIYELGYEINNRPTWTRVPLSGILRLLDEHALESGKRARVA
jgi:maltose alpha-D-glucosyltransferase/alpha-amylase